MKKMDFIKKYVKRQNAKETKRLQNERKDAVIKMEAANAQAAKLKCLVLQLQGIRQREQSKHKNAEVEMSAQQRKLETALKTQIAETAALRVSLEKAANTSAEMVARQQELETTLKMQTAETAALRVSLEEAVRKDPTGQQDPTGYNECVLRSLPDEDVYSASYLQHENARLQRENVLLQQYIEQQSASHQQLVSQFEKTIKEQEDNVNKTVQDYLRGPIRVMEEKEAAFHQERIAWVARFNALRQQLCDYEILDDMLRCAI